MNRDLLESQWVQIREILKDKFSNLTEEDIRQINGRYDQLVAKLQQKYGYTREEAEERIRAWNFDRFTSSKNNIIRDESIRRERDDSSIYKWLLGLGIPLVLLGAYLLSSRAEETRTPTVIHEQTVVETPADQFVSNGLRNALLTRQQSGITAAALQNVQITTHNGVVTLSGTVPNAETREFIGNTAQRFAGVREVNNLIEVK